MTTYANILENYKGFKTLFGEAAPEEQILHFVNSVLSENDLPKIVAITDISNMTEPLFRFIGGIHDVVLMYAKTENEEIVVIQGLMLQNILSID